MPINPIKSDLSYWNKKIAISDDVEMDFSLKRKQIGKNTYYGHRLKYGDKAGIIFKKIIPVLFISIVLAPITVPSLFLFSDTYRHLIRWIKEVHYGQKLKCINNVALKRINSSTSYHESSSSSKSSSTTSEEIICATIGSQDVPLEVLRLILASNIKFANEDRVKEYLTILSRVCKAWHSQIEHLKIDLINNGVYLEYIPEIRTNSIALQYIEKNALKLRTLKLWDYKFSLKEINTVFACSHLQSLKIAGEIIPKNMTRLQKLKELTIRESDFIEEGALNYPELEELIIEQSKMATLPSFDHLPKLKRLIIKNSYALKSLPSFDALHQLEFLRIWLNPLITSIPPLKLNQIKHLSISENPSLLNISSLDFLPELKELCFRDNPKLTNIPALDNLPKLKFLFIARNPQLTHLPSFEHLTHLKELTINRNNSIQTIPSVSHLTHLQSLTIIENKSLQNFPSIEGLKQLVNPRMRY